MTLTVLLTPATVGLLLQSSIYILRPTKNGFSVVGAIDARSQLELHLDLVDERRVTDGPLAQLRPLRPALHQHPLRARHARVVDEQLRERPLEDLYATLRPPEPPVPYTPRTHVGSVAAMMSSGRSSPGSRDCTKTV
eukprot:4999666-Pyramimonas_sp.AAC.1